jgi:hypothetical protein
MIGTMETVTCLDCGSQWPRISGDKNCCMCGKRLPHVLVEVSGADNFFADYPNDAEVTLNLTNVYNEAVLIKEIAQENPLNESCLFPDGEFEERMLETNESCKVTFRYRPSPTLAAIRTELQVTLFVVSESGTGNNTDRADLWVLPVPAVEPDSATIEPSRAGDGIRHYESRHRLNSVARDLFLGAEPVDPPPWCRHWSWHLMNDELVLHMEMDEAEIEGPTDHPTVGWRIDFRVSRPPLTADIKLLPSPVVFVDAEAEFSAYTGQLLWKCLAVKNISEEQLAHGDASIRVEQDGKEADVNEKAIQVFIKTGGSIEPGQVRSREGDVRLRIDGTELSPGTYNLSVSCGLQGRKNRYGARFTLHMEDLRIDDGIIAIDFGTSNTCCVHDDGRSEKGLVIPLDEPMAGADSYLNGQDRPEFIPSSLGLREPDEWLIGKDAEDQIENPEKLLKTRLGSDEYVLGPYSAKELVFFYIREVLWRAERYLRRRCSVLVLTYPTRFSNRQLDDYRWIISRLQGLYKRPPALLVETIDEASAGALEFVLDKSDEKQQFTLFVFDFGGGTIDMSLCDVVSGPEGKIEVRLLNMGGHRKLGGKDLDSIAMALIADAAKGSIAGIEAGEVVEIPYPRQIGDNETLDAQAEPSEAWIANRWIFQDKVEAVKVHLCSDDEDVHWEEALMAEIRTGRKLVRQVAMSEKIEISRPRFEAEVLKRLQEALTAMKLVLKPVIPGFSADCTPDYVYLTGQASQISHPDLKALIENELGELTLVELPRNPSLFKTCVAHGARRYGRQLVYGEGESDFKTIDLFRGKARSSIGYKGLRKTNYIFIPVISKGEALGRPVAIDNLRFARRTFEVMENFGSLNGIDGNPDVETIDKYEIDRSRFDNLTEEEWKRSHLVLTVNKDESTIVEIVVPSEEDGSPDRVFRLPSSRKQRETRM